MSRSALPLESLWVFHLVAETGSITGAAGAMKVTQPAISRRVRELEAELGCALVRRSSNALRLTEAGERFADELRDGFGRLEAATRALRAQNAPLRIRAYTTWALRWLIPRLPAFAKMHPGIEVEVSTSTAPIDLAREGVDAAIRTAPIDAPPAPDARRLQPVRIAPFAAPVLVKGWKRGTALPGRPLGSKVRAEDWRIWYRHAGTPPGPAPLFFESTTLAIQAALEGLGTVICPPDFVREEMRTGRLLPLTGESVLAGDSYWLILPQGRIGPALRTFVDWLLHEAAVEPDPVFPPPAGRKIPGGRRSRAA